MARTTDLQTLTGAIIHHALELGFAAAGCAPVTGSSLPAHRLSMMIDEKRHGTMQYLEQQQNERNDPALLLPGARTVLSVALSYNQPSNEQPSSGISRYATIPDYHRVMRDLLEQLLTYITTHCPEPVSSLICVDGAPVYEKSWARHAGIGATGNNTLCIVPGCGTACFLGEILLDIDLHCPPHKAEEPCGTCTRCLDACPTGALTAPGTLDARRCISYLTVEHKDDFTPEEEEMVGTHLFGCDICQDVCPHNQNAHTPNHPLFQPRKDLLTITPEQVLQLTRSQFKKLFAGTPIYRTGLKRLRRNARAVLNNRKTREVTSNE